MAGNAKLKSRINTLKNLNSIFSAMQVIAVAKLSKVKERYASARKFRDGMAEIRRHFPILEENPKKVPVAAVLITGNRGLCGTFNQDVLLRAQSFIKEQKDISFFVFGRKGYDFLKSKKQNIVEAFISESIEYETVRALAELLWQSFRDGSYSEIYFIHNHFHTTFNRRAEANRILPEENHSSDSGMAIVEPDIAVVTEKANRMFLEAALYFNLYEGLLGELSARMVTLKSAIDNSKELINELVIMHNKARQQAITQEILEIVEASEAMKGAILK